LSRSCLLAGGRRELHQGRISPFPQVPLIASGGVNYQTVVDFSLAGAVAVGIGANLIPPEAVHRSEPGWVRESAHRYLNLVAQARNQRKAQ
jgi:2-dehydro-3-deoxyphosphogluconate aldolase / (4S)-4-hydroxy-2-oxoglutarate aldolase